MRNSILLDSRAVSQVQNTSHLRGGTSAVGLRAGVSPSRVLGDRACLTGHNCPEGPGEGGKGREERGVVYYLAGAGTVVKLKAAGLQSRMVSSKAVIRRGTIKEFSRRSRKRMMVKVFSIDWEKVRMEEVFFVHLTYHSVPDDGRKVKGHLQAFFKRLDRLFGKGNWGCIWKMEFQRRQAVHFHLVIRVVGVPEVWREKVKGLSVGDAGFIYLFRKWVSKSWNEITGEDEEHLKAGTRVERPYSRRGVIRYLLKYIGKVQVYPEGSSGWGRWWGLARREVFCIEWDLEVISYDEFCRIRRIIRTRFKWVRSRSPLQGVTVVWGFKTWEVYYQLVEYVKRERSYKVSRETWRGRENVSRETY